MKSWFSVKVPKIDKHLVRLIREREEKTQIGNNGSK